LAADEKLDWQAAMNVLRRAGIRSSLEMICRQYADLCAAAGGAGLLTDIVRKNASIGPAKHMPIQLGRLKDSHSLFYRLQQQIAKDAGIQWKQNALRHTCISACVAIDKNVPQVAYESGNSTSIIK
jgi:hypothetical protein